MRHRPALPILTLLAAAAWLVPARPAHAQFAIPGPDVALLGGVTPNEHDGHASIGVLARFELGRWALIGTGMVGRGDGYASRLLGGALARRVIGLGPLSLWGFAGYGAYREAPGAGPVRTSEGVMGGGMARLDLGLFSVTAMAHDIAAIRARHDGRVPALHSARYSIAIGF